MSSNRKTSNRKTSNRKTKVIIPVSPIGILGLYGYYSRDPIRIRHQKLDKMIKYHKYKDIISRLNATAIRLKRTQPVITENIRSDMLYLKKKYRPDLWKKYKEKNYKKITIKRQIIKR